MQKNDREFVNTVNCNEEPVPMPLTVANSLRAERTRIMKDAQRKVKKIDMTIGLLESTEAESVMETATRILTNSQRGEL